MQILFHVVRVLDHTVLSIDSFPASPAGQAAALARFQELHTEHNDPDGTTGVPRPTAEEFTALFESATGYDDGCGYRLQVLTGCLDEEVKAEGGMQDKAEGGMLNAE